MWDLTTESWGLSVTARSHGRIAICVSTLHRPEGLRRLLSSLGRMSRPADHVLELVVVENQAAEASTLAAAELAELAGMPCRLLHEERRGIPHARNAAIAEVVDRVDWLAFVDDDEEVDEAWLQTLVRHATDRGLDGATGPNVPSLPAGAASWVAASGVFEPLRTTTGTPVDRGFTCNLLLSADALRGLDRWFDPELALTGGSDTELTRRLVRAGRRLEWVDEAVTIEHVPASRATLPWVLRRAWRVGTQRGWLERHRPESGQGSVVRRAFGSVAIAVLAVLAAPLLAVAAPPQAIRKLRAGVASAGYLAGLLGLRHAEYRRLHADHGLVR